MRISDWSSDVCSSDLLTGPDGEIWRLAMGHTPIFPVATPEAFVALQRAARPDPATGKPDPAAIDRKSGAEGKSVSVRVDLGGRSIIKKNTANTNEYITHNINMQIYQ